MIMKSLMALVIFSLVGALPARTVSADETDPLSDVEAVVADIAIGRNLDPTTTRRCFVALQSVIDMNLPADAEPLTNYLEDICLGGLDSELERMGVFYLLQEAGHDVTLATLPPTELQLDASVDLRISIQACWNVGALSTEALGTSVVVSFDLGEDGRPDAESLNLVRFSGGSEAAAQQAYEAARRAIIRCGINGLGDSLQRGTYTLDFNPEGMRVVGVRPRLSSN